jgi:hypothetical protein
MVMENTALEHFIARLRHVWGPLSTELVEACQAQLTQLLNAPPTEDWLAELHLKEPARAELYRDPDHGFVLLAHAEHAGLYRSPHDHGRSWVLYGVQQGEVEMGTYVRIEDPGGQDRLVKRNTTIVRPGQVQVYLPGDIHDTRCLTETAFLFRFSERDLRLEDQRDHCVTRYVRQGGIWTTGTP